MVKVAERREHVSNAEIRLSQAEALVARDPEVLGGEPCVRNTRIPAYLVGALAQRHGVEETHATYPSLSRQTIELVALYVQTHPRAGRPRHAELSEPTAVKRGRARKSRPG